MSQLTSPISGKILRINITPGQKVTEDDALFIIEALKEENPIFSDPGIVTEVKVSIGDEVKEGDVLAIIA